MKQRNTGKRFNDDFRKMVVDLYHSGRAAISHRSFSIVLGASGSIRFPGN